MTLASTKSADKRSLLTPLAPLRNRTSEVVERLRAEITSGKLKPGARLPTEQALMSALGVSRTVVREAVAALKAEGLVTTRQGAGAFVAADVQRRPFRIDPDGLQSIAEVLNVMELRMAVEVEAAAFAAERCGAAGIRAISKALDAIERAIKRGEPAIDQDFEFHHAIAKATGNPQFARFLEFLGRFIIPRQSVRVTAIGPSQSKGYLETIQAEHCRIYDAIRDRDVTGAREAMRRHLVNGRERYRRLAAKSNGA
ncbi:MAG TPA: FadR/GntR family transcriptional regulator [Alphaproteobacteria bacterium]